MTLTLEVTSAQAATLGSSSCRVFSKEGGTIGRAASSDWILSHRKVSGRHATISFQDGVYYIVDDTSANGVFINSTKNRLIPGRRYALKSGDHIIIDPYEIEVSISTERAHERRPLHDSADVHSRDPRGPFDPFQSADPFAPPGVRTPTPVTPPSAPFSPTPAGEVVPLEELDPLKLLEGKSKPPPPRHAPTAKDLEKEGSLLAGHYAPPAIQTPPPSVVPGNAPLIPADYDPLGPDEPDEPPFVPPTTAAPVTALELPPAPPPTPPPAPRRPEAPVDERPAAAPAAAAVPARGPSPGDPPVPHTPASAPAREPSDPGLRAVLEGAGLESAPVTAEFARGFGQIFRVVVSGVMDVLRARQELKGEFRMRHTQFRPADNNPLKFSANVDDALHNLLVKRNAAYLEPVEAFEDAFDDLRDHQMAMLAGMRVAFESMLAHFNPDHLQEQFDRQLKRTALSSMTARLRYWELYREGHLEMVKDSEATFRRLFGEEFARAYEEQLKRLKADRRALGAVPRPPEG